MDGIERQQRKSTDSPRIRFVEDKKGRRSKLLFDPATFKDEEEDKDKSVDPDAKKVIFRDQAGGVNLAISQTHFFPKAKK